MKKILVFLGVIVVTLLGGYLYISTTDTTPISHYWDGYTSWYKSTGEAPITGDETRFLGDTHRGEQGYRVIYVNEKGANINKGSSPYIYPEGTVIVKEQYKDKDQYEAGKKPDLTIMIKLASGASPETGDWGYVSGFRRKIYQGNSGRAEFCGGCHAGANLKKGDYVFVNSTTHTLVNN